MSRTWSSLTLFLLIQCVGSVSANDCPQDLRRANSPKTPKLTRPDEHHTSPLFMWRYRTLTGELYLVGSIHALSATLRTLPVQLESAFQQSTHLAVEVDTTSPNILDRTWVTEHLLLPNNSGLRSLLNETRRGRLSCLVRQINIDYESIGRLKPSLVAMQISRARLNGLGYYAKWGMEQQFLRRAGRREVLELESSQEQLLLIANTPVEVQLELFDESLIGHKDFHAEFVALMSAWLTGDDESLIQLLRDQDHHSTDYRDFQDRLINQRNIRFAQKIETFLASPGTYFVLVGAAHLVGSGGLVQLLDARGHKGHRVFSGDRIDP